MSQVNISAITQKTVLGITSIYVIYIFYYRKSIQIFLKLKFKLEFLTNFSVQIPLKLN